MMDIQILKLVLFLPLFLQKIKTEDSFCDNKCFGEGVVTSRSCYCDKACAIYKDCCSDSIHYNVNKDQTINTNSFTCKRNTLVVSECSPDWKGPEFIMKSCKINSNQEVDPVGHAPVTSEITGVTYNNYYCAICNGDSERTAVWNIKVSCPHIDSNLQTDKEEAFKHIFYNLPTKEWGYVLRDNSTKKLSFHACAVISEIPKKHASKVRQCEIDEVKTCDSTWKNDLIKQMCSAYTDPVFYNNTRYKNFYCAVCNRIDQSLINCGNGIGPRTSILPEPEENNKLSFSLLLDINFSDGNIVGKRLSTMTCLPGEIFDPFARRCRNIVCAIPGYILQNGLCVPSPTSPL